MPDARVELTTIARAKVEAERRALAETREDLKSRAAKAKDEEARLRKYAGDLERRKQEIARIKEGLRRLR